MLTLDWKNDLPGISRNLVRPLDVGIKNPKWKIY